MPAPWMRLRRGASELWRLGAVLVVSLALGGCATVAMDEAEVAGEATDALTEVGLPPTDVSVEPAGSDEWEVSADTGVGTLALTVDGTTGEVTTLAQPDGVTLTDDQLDGLARHRGNPAQDAAERRRTVVAVVVALAALAGFLGWARRTRLREAAADTVVAGDGVDVVDAGGAQIRSDDANRSDDVPRSDDAD